MIQKGIGKVPGDSNSPEIALVNFNLMSEGAVTLEEWSPQIPPMKGGGIWSDSPLTDGRSLMAAPAGNVVEKITILIADSAYLEVAKQLETLSRLTNDCRDFWQSQAQVDPVYLTWAAGCNNPPLPQYALLYNIDIGITYLAADRPSVRVTLSLEREPYWRGIPPGANPKMWTDYVNSSGVKFNNTNATLITSTDDLVYDTAVKNRMEWNPTGYQSLLSKNYVDIPATSIPGDAPALVSLAVEISNSAAGVVSPQIFVAQSSKPTSMVDRTGVNYPQAYVFPAGDGILVAGGFAKTIDANCGCLSNGSAVNKQLVSNAAYAVGTNSPMMVFRGNGTVGFFDLSVIRGTFIAFLRCKQLTGVAGDVQAQLTFSESTGTLLTGQWTNLPIIAANFGVCGNHFDLLYLGTVTVPAGNKSYSSPDGLGLNVAKRTTAAVSPTLGLNLKNVSAAPKSVEILDLILLPTDESILQLIAPDATAQRYFFYDTTGYLSHGFQQPMSILAIPGTNEVSQTIIQTLGTDLTLVPRANNRLYFINRRGNNPLTTYYSAPDSENDMIVRVNIVPRWSGIRNV